MLRLDYSLRPAEDKKTSVDPRIFARFEAFDTFAYKLLHDAHRQRLKFFVV